MKKFADYLLRQIKINQKPLSLDRLQWWLIIILTKLFGRNVEIAGTGGQTLRIFPVIWGQKVHLLGSEHKFLQIDFSSPYTLRLKICPSVPLTEGTPVQFDPARGDLTAHIMLCHLPAPKTERIMRHLQEVGGDYEIVLAYGGTAEDFSQINYQKKIFIPDPSLRGFPHCKSYYDLIDKTKCFLASHHINPEWIFISDYDLVPLKKAYLNELVSLMKSQGAGFGGKQFFDVSLSNCFFLLHAIQEGLLEKMPSINNARRGPFYHCLGAAMLFHRSCFDAMTEFKEMHGGFIYELILPTIAGLKGFRLLSFDEYSNVFQHVYYQPVFSCAEALKIADEGYALIHPLKEVTEFLAMRDARQASKVEAVV